MKTPTMCQGGILQLPGKSGQHSVTSGRKEGRRGGKRDEEATSCTDFSRKAVPWDKGILSLTLFLHQASLYKEGRELTLTVGRGSHPRAPRNLSEGFRGDPEEER